MPAIYSRTASFFTYMSCDIYMQVRASQCQWRHNRRHQPHVRADALTYDTLDSLSACLNLHLYSYAYLTCTRVDKIMYLSISLYIYQRMHINTHFFYVLHRITNHSCFTGRTPAASADTASRPLGTGTTSKGTLLCIYTYLIINVCIS